MPHLAHEETITGIGREDIGLYSINSEHVDPAGFELWIFVQNSFPSGKKPLDDSWRSCRHTVSFHQLQSQDGMACQGLDSD